MCENTRPRLARQAEAVAAELEAQAAAAAAPSSLFIVSVKKKFRLLRANCKKGIANKALTQLQYYKTHIHVRKFVWLATLVN